MNLIRIQPTYRYFCPLSTHDEVSIVVLAYAQAVVAAATRAAKRSGFEPASEVDMRVVYRNSEMSARPLTQNSRGRSRSFRSAKQFESQVSIL